MRNERFFKNPRLPFAELRCSRSSTASFKPHMHRCLSIGAVDQGRVLYNVNDMEAVLAPGSLIIINPETLHACNPASEAGRSYYMLHLDTDWCLQVQTSLWEVDRLVEAAKTRIDDGPLYRQYCETMALLMDAQGYLQEKELGLYDLVVGVFSAACSPRAIRKERKDRIEKLKTLLAAGL